MQSIIEFLDFLIPYGTVSYWIMFGVLLACGFGFPMPEDVVLITGGILSGRGVCNFWLTLIVCMSGVLLGDGIVYYLGRFFGQTIKKTWLFRRIMTDSINEKVEKIFKKHGDKIVFMGRFMPGLRMPIFLTAGIYRLSPWKFFLLDFGAAIISVPVWIYIGFLFGENLEDLYDWVMKIQTGIFLLLGFFIIVFTLSILRKRRRKKGPI